MILRTTAAAVAALTLCLGSVTAHAADVLGTAAANPDLKMFSKLVEASGVSAELEGEGPFTVFAPTDKAFEQVPGAMLDNLMKPENKEDLARIVKFHVLPSKVTAADLEGKTAEFETLSQAKMNIDGTSDTVFVEEGAIETADVAADNGVIHVIDTVVGIQ